MNVKKNIFFNTLLSFSNYVFPIISFPYVSRKLGVDSIGICNFVDGIIQYYSLFSAMGIGIIGIREIAKNKDNQENLNKTFSNLLLLNATTTAIAIIILFISIHFTEALKNHKELFYIGSAKIIATLFVIEWFYKGMENFKYITFRNILIKAIYIILLFIFVNQKSDYMVYYFLTVLSVIISAILNYSYSRNFVVFDLKSINFKLYIKSFITLGLYMLLNSMYSTFNIVYLGLVSGTHEVGIYTTATKILSISLALLSPFTNVMLPRISALIEEGNYLQINNLINKSFDILLTISVPLVAIIINFAPQLIIFFAGREYSEAVLPIQIGAPLILIIGIEQILIIQLLMPFKLDRAILINSLIGTLCGLVSATLLIKNYQSTGSTISWLLSELCVLASAAYFVSKKINIRLPSRDLMVAFLKLLVYLGVNYFISSIATNIFSLAIISVGINVILFVILEIILLKNNLVNQYYTDIRKRIVRSLQIGKLQKL